MLWDHYVLRRGNAVYQLWERLFEKRPLRLLYIAGRGFDVRANKVIKEFVDSLRASGRIIDKAELVLVQMAGYELDANMAALTEKNALYMTETFAHIGASSTVTIGSLSEEEDLSPNIALSTGVKSILDLISDQTDIILDVSSLPRVAYLSLLTGILAKLISNDAIHAGNEGGLFSNGINFQVLVAEDAKLDAQIRAEDPSNELVLIPGFSGAMHLESVRDLPLIWFPILGENRLGQLQKLIALAEIPDAAEICPVLPHPSRDARRADKLLIEYREPLFESRNTPRSNILYVHESNPFEAYRQLLKAMRRYKESMAILGGCRFIVTPLSSKLVTIGVGLACFEMRSNNMAEYHAVAIPHAEPKRYAASVQDLETSKPEISSLLLTGEAYAK